MIIAQIRYQHDKNAEVVSTSIIAKQIEDGLGKLRTVYLSTCDGKELTANARTSRGAHSDMIWYADSRIGGFVETYTPNGKDLLYVHPAHHWSQQG